MKVFNKQKMTITLIWNSIEKNGEQIVLRIYPKHFPEIFSNRKLQIIYWVLKTDHNTPERAKHF